MGGVVLQLRRIDLLNGVGALPKLVGQALDGGTQLVEPLDESPKVGFESGVLFQETYIGKSIGMGGQHA